MILMKNTKTVEYKEYAIGHIGFNKGSGGNTHILHFRSFEMAGSNKKIIRYTCMCQTQFSQGCISGSVKTKVSEGLTDISQITCKKCLKYLQNTKFKESVIAGITKTVYTVDNEVFFY